MKKRAVAIILLSLLLVVLFVHPGRVFATNSESIIRFYVENSALVNMEEEQTVEQIEPPSSDGTKEELPTINEGELPQTGVMNQAYLVTLGSAIIGIVGLFIIIKNKERRKENEKNNNYLN